MVFNNLSATEMFSGPWGKDEELENTSLVPEKKSGPLVFCAELAIAFHQQVISPADGPRSHYYPSSSEYMLRAIQRYGFIPGYLLGCDRLLRENREEWIYPTIIHPERGFTKYDPVP